VPPAVARSSGSSCRIPAQADHKLTGSRHL
jgi:hypothetical protein